MADMIRAGEPVIDDSTPANAPEANAGMKGCVPRDFGLQPVRAYSTVDMPLIPRAEWSARLKAMTDGGSRLSDLRLVSGPGGGPIPSLDQGPVGYCWAHSTTMAAMMARAVMGLPYLPLSAYAVAATIKGGRDEGGWGAQSLQFATERGIPAQSFWPQGSRDLSRGTPACWDNAKLHRVSESWADVAAPVYGRQMSFDQVATCLLCRVPVVGDFNWWGHSVCLLDLVETAPGVFGVRIINSWGEGWGDRGMGVLAGSKAIPDNATAPRVVLASAA